MELHHSVFLFLVPILMSSSTVTQETNQPCYNLTDIVEIVPSGVDGTNVDWTQPPSKPNEYGMYRSKVPGSFFPLGETKVTYAFVYSAPGKGTEICSFTVTVRESNCPNGVQEIRCAVDPCQTSDCPAFPDALCFPNYCGSCSAQFFDSDGNRLDCTAVPVDRPPVVTSCPRNIGVMATEGETTGIAAWSEPSVEDDSGIPTTVNSTHSSGSSFPVGVTLVVYTFTDGAGNTARCNFTVTVFTGEDTTPPEIENCPSDIRQTVPPGQTFTLVRWQEPSASDDREGNVTMKYKTLSAPSLFIQVEAPPIKIEYVFEDKAGNEAICTFTVAAGANCPDGSEAITCIGNLCDSAECPAFPDAQCKPNYCGECSAEFYDARGTRVNCTHTGTCPDGSQPVTCTANPCNNTKCPAFPDARCSPNYCGECIAEFYDDRGLKVDCTQTGTCSDGSQPVACTTNPCDNMAECPAFPDAQCRPMYCGGCFADFYDARGAKVDCTGTGACPDGSQPVTCTANPCDGSECPAFPNAQCIINYCGECSAEFFDDRRAKVNCTQTDTCPDGSEPVTCTTNPCDNSECPAFPDARCSPNYCGECSAEFYDDRGTKVDCTQTDTCSDGSQPVTCAINPCDNSECPAFPDAYCKPNYCGRCGAEFYDEKGTKVDCTQTGTCPDGSQPVTCTANPCNNTKCPAFPDARCSPNYCGECSAEFYDARGTRVNCNQTGTCRDGSQPFTCEVNPCEVNKCAAFSDARCTPNYCGGCFAEFYGSDGSRLECADNGTCPDGSLPVPCAADPCLVNSCPAFPQARCVPNYCGGCNAEFYDDARGRVDCTVDNGVDRTPPVISDCPGDMQFPIPSGHYFTEATWTEPTATDKSSVTMQYKSLTEPFVYLGIGGSVAVRYVFQDEAGNEAICSFTVSGVEAGAEDTIPPVVQFCPADIVRTLDPGQDGDVVTWATPVAVDDSQNEPSLRASHTSGSLFRAGISTVVNTFSDAAGNTATCTFTVNLIAVPAVSACSTSPCQNGGRCVETGNTYVCICQAAFTGPLCEINTTPSEDTTPPVIDRSCPTDISATVDPGQTQVSVIWLEPTATDNSGVVSVSNSHAPGYFFPVGMTAVTYEFTDPSGNLVTCSFNVNVAGEAGGADNTPPEVIGCSPNIQHAVPQSLIFDFITWEEPTASDSQSEPTTLQYKSHINPSMFVEVGKPPREVLYTFEDAAGNEATCSFTVSAVVEGTEDIIPPVINGCPGDLTVTADPGQTSVEVNWVEPTASDDSGSVPTMTTSHNPGSDFPVIPSTTTVTYIFSDAAGNTATCSFTVTIIVEGTEDTIPPVINGCPVDLTVTADPGQTSVEVNWVEPTATDNSGSVPTMTTSHNPGSNFPVIPSTTTVTYTFSDAAGNIAACSFTVTIIVSADTVPPVIEDCPVDFTVSANPGATGATVVWEPPTATDDSGEIPELFQTHAPGFFLVGVTRVTYLFTDSAANEATCVFRVTVSVSDVDTTPPDVINCPNDISMTVSPGQQDVIANWNEPTATDDSNVTPTVSRSHIPGSAFSVGTAVVTYVFADSSGNIARCVFSVIVSEGTGADVTPPEISGCPSNIQHSVPSGQIFDLASWEEPTAFDAVSGAVQPYFRSLAFPSLFVQVGGQPFTVEYKFTDDAGNEAVCAFTVTAAAAGSVDTTSPVITYCPDDITLPESVDQDGTPVTWSEPTATDESGNVLINSVSHNSGDFFPVGSTTVIYDFRDPAGNQAECIFNVVVFTLEPNQPVITSCPNDIAVTAAQGQTTSIVTWVEPTATDGVGNIAVSNTHNSGSSFDVGVTSVTYTFTDSVGNSATCTFAVTVIVDTGVDTTPPNIENCPGDIRQPVQTGLIFTLVEWEEPTINDANEQTAVTLRFKSLFSPSLFVQVGADPITIEYIFEDEAGNEAVCTFTVAAEVGQEDNVPPVVNNCPSDISISATPGQTVGIATWSEPTAEDNSNASPSVSRTHPSGSSFPVGTTAVTFTFADSSGNIARCIFNVIVSVSVTPTTPPQFTCNLPDISQTIPQGSEEIAVGWVEQELLPRIVLLTQSHQPGSIFTVGTTEVTYIYIHGLTGQQYTCSFNVIITEGSSSGTDINCPNDINMPVSPNQNYVQVDWKEPSGTIEGHEVNVVSRSHSVTSMFVEVGKAPVTVTYELSDGNGNQADCSFNITTSVDNIPPVVSQCPQDVTVNIGTGTVSGEATWTPPTATDNSGLNVTLTSNFDPNSAFPVGSTEVRYTATDAVGNTDQSCSFNVIVTVGGGSDLCNPSPCSHLELCYYTTTDYVCISSGVSSGRKRRDVTGACKSNSCGPHSTCLAAVNEEDFICVCDEGWPSPQCYTAATHNHQSKMDSELAPKQSSRIANETYLMLGFAILGLLVVIMTLAVVVCFVSHRFINKQTKSVNKQALLCNDYNDIKVISPQV